jgi:nucleoside-diphosphate-sugar epimerase
MEALVTGGNGFVGRHVVSALQERGDGVRVLALPGDDTSWLEDRGVRVCRGDICDAESLVEPMRGVDGVLHLAAMMDVWRPLEDYRAVNVDGTERVCRAALHAGVRRLVHMSSTSVYGMQLGRPADETFPLAPFRDPYPVTKAEGEGVVRQIAAAEGLPAVIVRPDQIFGPGDQLHFARTADRLRAGKAIIIGSGDNAVPLVYVTDVVQGLLLALDHERAVGETYNITNDRPLTQAQFLEAIAREVGAEPPRVHIPYQALYAAGYAAERVAAVAPTSRRPPITRLGVVFYGTDNRYAIDKARRELGYRPRIALPEGVRLAADWYRRGVGTLAGEVAIVTGASSGIGAATAQELARRGATVVLAARRADALEAQAKAIAQAGGRAVAIPTDVTDRGQVSRLAEQAVDAFGHVDVLVNNAGAAPWSKPVAASSGDEVASLLEVNLLGAMQVTRAVLPEMLRRRHGTIVSVGSVSGRVAMEPLYSASKYGLRGFTLALRRQLTGSGVSVSLVSPGKIRTAMTRDERSRMPEPEVVATAIADLVTRPRREVVVPRRHHGLVWLEQLLPAVTDLAHRLRHWG